MKHLPSFIALAALAFAPTLAKADPITYTFNQSLVQDANDYATVTGTVTTDGKLGNITPADITNFDLFVNETASALTQSLEISTALALAANPGFSGVSGSGSFTAAADTLSFDFSQASVYFGGYGTGYLVFTGSLESIYVNSFPYRSVTAPESGVQVVATVVPSSVTPEPSSLLLLGTGALGMAGAVRRRFLRASFYVPTQALHTP